MLPVHTRFCVVSHNCWEWVKWKIGPSSIQKCDSNKAVAAVYKNTVMFVKSLVLALCIVHLPRISHQRATLMSSNLCSWSARSGLQSYHPIDFCISLQKNARIIKMIVTFTCDYISLSTSGIFPSLRLTILFTRRPSWCNLRHGQGLQLEGAGWREYIPTHPHKQPLTCDFCKSPVAVLRNDDKRSGTGYGWIARS
jgi:hypothetical protein